MSTKTRRSAAIIVLIAIAAFFAVMIAPVFAAGTRTCHRIHIVMPGGGTWNVDAGMKYSAGVGSMPLEEVSAEWNGCRGAAEIGRAHV